MKSRLLLSLICLLLVASVSFADPVSGGHRTVAVTNYVTVFVTNTVEAIVTNEVVVIVTNTVSVVVTNELLVSVTNEPTVLITNVPLVRVTDDGTGLGQLDNATWAFTTIEYEHHEVHSGSAYHVQLTTADLGAETGDQLQFTFLTPDTTEWVHMLIDAYGSGQLYYTLREAPTNVIVGGTTVTSFNHNRNSVNTSNLEYITNGATAGIGGVLLNEQYLGSGKDKIAGDSRGQTEWVLKSNTVYAVRVYSTAAIQAVLTLDWYEHTDRQ